jgi:hypothetical protein
MISALISPLLLLSHLSGFYGKFSRHLSRILEDFSDFLEFPENLLDGNFYGKMGEVPSVGDACGEFPSHP